MSRRIVQVLSWLALAYTIAPPILFLAGKLTLEQSKLHMLLATVAWFIATPLWMGREPATE
jgi:hypothetical protein